MRVCHGVVEKIYVHARGALVYNQYYEAALKSSGKKRRSIKMKNHSCARHRHRITTPGYACVLRISVIRRRERKKSLHRKWIAAVLFRSELTIKHGKTILSLRGDRETRNAI